MLGTRRAGITEAAGQLQEAGAIKDARGHTNLIDRRKLESISCPCYPLSKKEFDRLLG